MYGNHCMHANKAQKYEYETRPGARSGIEARSTFQALNSILGRCPLQASISNKLRALTQFFLYCFHITVLVSFDGALFGVHDTWNHLSIRCLQPKPAQTAVLAGAKHSKTLFCEPLQETDFWVLKVPGAPFQPKTGPNGRVGMSKTLFCEPL